MALAVALAAPAAGTAASKALWYQDEYDRIARDISGVSDIRLLMEDEWSEWTPLAEDPHGQTLGFVCPFAPSSHWCYHRIFVSPLISATLGLQSHRYVWDLVGDRTIDYRAAAIAVLTFVHEAYHYRLLSGDESRVNACALRDLPVWLERDFRIPPTTLETKSVPVTTWEVVRRPYRVRAWVRRNGKRVRAWLTRYRSTRVATTEYVQRTETVPNPTFNGIVAAAAAFRASQPAPYNTGTCY